MNSAAKIQKNIFLAESLAINLLKWNNFLQINLATNTNNAVGTGERVADKRLPRGDTIISIIHRLEITSFECQLVCGLVIETETEAIAVHYE